MGAPSIIGSLADVEAIESIPLSERELPRSTYEAIEATAKARPDALAIRYIESGEGWRAGFDAGKTGLSCDLTYHEFFGRINQIANLLHALGVRRGDVVSMVLPNLPETYCVMWAGEAAGVINPVNYLLGAEQIGQIIASAQSKVLIIMGEHDECDVFGKLDAIRAQASCIEHVIVVGLGGGEGTGYLDFEEAVGAHSAASLDFEPPASPDTISALFQTGGTTGLPKLAKHSHRNEVYLGWVLNYLYHFKPGDTALVGLPLFHCNAMISSGLTAFMAGATVLMTGIHGYRSRGILDNLFQLISAYNVMTFSGVPTIYARLLQLPTEGCDLSSLRQPVCGAAPMPVQLFHDFESKIGVRVSEGYGLTEATVCSTACPTQVDPPRIGSIGLRLPYTDVKAAVLDMDGNYVRDCDIDEIGTILVSGPSITPGYTDESKNAALFVVDEAGTKWINTGDLARQDADGFFWLTGRSKELIIRGGHNIDPKMIEEALAAHPAVNLAAAVGRPDPDVGEVPVAYVDLLGEASEAELIEWCRAHVGERAAVPKAIVTLDALPVTGVGKIDKPTLNLMEIQYVVTQELANLGHLFKNTHVEAFADTKLGNTANIQTTCADGVDLGVADQAVRNLLDRFSFCYVLETRP